MFSHKHVLVFVVFYLQGPKGRSEVVSTDFCLGWTLSSQIVSGQVPGLYRCNRSVSLALQMWQLHV